MLPIISLILVTCLPGVGLAHGHHHRHHSCGSCDCPQGDHCWDRSSGGSFSTTELHGTIDELIYLPGSSPVELRLSAKRGEVLVRLAPAEYLTDHELSLREGQSVTVNGFWVETAKDDLLVATKVQAGGALVSLRDRRGRPLWR
jgi:hypothetical protein